MEENLTPVPQLLKDSLFLVTGAGQGNGRAIAAGVAATGAKVIVTDVRQDTAETAAHEIRSGGGKAWAYQLDVTDAAACAELSQRVEREVGPANVVVNNAGIIIRETIDSPKAPENWRRVMDVNVNGIFNVVHAWLPALRKTRGNIINVASIASFVGVGSTLGYPRYTRPSRPGASPGGKPSLRFAAPGGACARVGNRAPVAASRRARGRPQSSRDT